MENLIVPTNPQAMNHDFYYVVSKHLANKLLDFWL